MVVTLELKNKTSDRQSPKQEQLQAIGAKLIDQSNKTYEMDLMASDATPTGFYDKPFKPQEARTIKLNFDMPKSAKPDRLEDVFVGDESVVLKFPKPTKSTK